jgi:hypothetical protein
MADDDVPPEFSVAALHAATLNNQPENVRALLALGIGKTSIIQEALEIAEKDFALAEIANIYREYQQAIPEVLAHSSPAPMQVAPFGTKQGLEDLVRGIGSFALPIENLHNGDWDLQPAAGHAYGQLLGKCPQLTNASLNKALFTKEGLEGLVRGIGSAALPNKLLRLSDFDIQAAAGHALGQLLGKCPQLKKAELGGNKALFTKEGLEDLVRGIGSAALPIEQLHLNDCDIQPAAGHALGQLLGKCPQLKLDAEHLLGVDANILDQLRAEMQKQ